MEDIEKHFISSYKSNLTQEGKEICEEILVMIGEKDEMLIDKAKVFCEYFIFNTPDVDKTMKLERRCKKYLNDLYNFNDYKQTFKRNTMERERFFDMGEINLQNRNIINKKL